MSGDPDTPGHDAEHPAPGEFDGLAGRRDESLLPYLREGERLAVAEIERRWGDELRGRCTKLVGDPMLAADIVQDLLVQVCRSDEVKLPERHLRAWLHSVARNRCVDELRKRRVRRAAPIDRGRSQGGWDVPDSGSTPAARVLRRERNAAVLDAIDRFEPDLRDVLVMRYFDELPREEIARRLGISVGTVKARLGKAVAKLRTHLASVRVGGSR